jgi:hypothetical protein
MEVRLIVLMDTSWTEQMQVLRYILEMRTNWRTSQYLRQFMLCPDGRKYLQPNFEHLADKCVCEQMADRLTIPPGLSLLGSVRELPELCMRAHV